MTQKSGQFFCNCRMKLIGEEDYRFRIERGKIQGFLMKIVEDFIEEEERALKREMKEGFIGF